MGENAPVSEARIVAASESPYARRPGPEQTTIGVLADAARRALDDANLVAAELDGLAVASFSLAPDHAIDLAWRLGLRVRWLMDDASGGASGINMLQHAMRAVEAGDASNVLVVAGDVLTPADVRRLADGSSSAAREHLAPLPLGGANALFALLTRRHMLAHGLSREDYGRLVVAQRAWAAENPHAVYNTRLTLREYLHAPIVSDPLCRFDCAPVVAGANAIIVSSGEDGVRVRALAAFHNADLQEGDGLHTGLAVLGLWDRAGIGPDDVDVVAVCDDYPVLALVQLTDLRFGDDPRRLIARIAARDLAVNTSGGQLAAGQAGAAGGLHGVVEAVTQLRGRAGRRQVHGARLAVATGYGRVVYRHGACTNVVVLES
jgi:acetyl-CoA acetyltransferase